MVALLPAGIAAAPEPPAATPPTAIASPASVAADGVRRARLVVPAFGRYAVAVRSPKGARLEVVDRMAGTLGVAGEAGASDGRLDLFLDRGEYLALIESPPAPAAGSSPARAAAPVVAIEMRPAVERNGEPGPMLVEWKPVATDLGDHEQRSYWLDLPARRTVFLEAAGRHLADLRLWRDGSWLEDAAPECSVRQPVPGQPLRVCRLQPLLEPGLYRLTAYGDAGQPWSIESPDRPLHLRWGLTELPESGRQTFTMGAFGSELFQVPAAANFFRLELPAAGEARLRVGPLAAGLPRWEAGSATATLVKETRPPVVELDGDAISSERDEGDYEADAESDEYYEDEYQDSDEYEEPAARDPEEDATAADAGADVETPAVPLRYVEVTAAPGQVFVLQQFERRDEYTFQRSGRYWLSTIHTGPPGDSIDATAVLTATTSVNGEPRQRVVASAAVPLAADAPWARRCNLLGEATVFFDVATAGRYQVVARGTGARFRMEPFFTSPPRNYKTPPWRRSGDGWDLPAGLHVLTIDPESQGILEVGVRPAGRFETLLDSPAPAVRGAASFGAVQLVADTVYTLHHNIQPGVTSGVVLRELPLDLRRALPLALQPGEEAVVDFTVEEAGVLVAGAEDGARFELALEDAAAAATVDVPPGAHRVRVVNASPATAVGSLRIEPLRLAAATPAVPLPAGALDALPEFPELIATANASGAAAAQPSAGAAVAHLELERGASQTFVVRAPQPGLYALQSSGLLATAGNLRTRTVTSLAQGAQNGTGRNFLLQEYLGAAEYQLTVSAQGRSAGHLGVEIRPTSLRDGGALRPGVPARATLAAGEGMVYAVEIPEAGEYRLRATGAGYLFAARLEDREGWPIEPPGSEADVTRDLQVGTYRLLLLPREVESRVIVTLERSSVGRRGEGHGPIALSLGEIHHHLWRESGADAEREPDRYRFSLPAPARVTLALDGEMQARLVAPSETGAAPIAIPPGRPWSRDLAPGTYALEVESSRRNNLVPYSVTVSTEELVAGTTRELEVPGSIPVSTGREGMVEISSNAPFPVRATLYALEPAPHGAETPSTAVADGAESAAAMASRILPRARGAGRGEIEGPTGGQRVVARSQGQPDDWNFLLAERLAPGRYRLVVEPLGDESAPVGVTMRSPRLIEAPPAPLPWRRELAPADAVHLLPMSWPAGADLLVVRVHAQENVACAIETSVADTLDPATAATAAWREIAKQAGRNPELLIALDPKSPAPLRLRLWSLDRRELPLRLEVTASRLGRLREAQLRAGATLPKAAGASAIRAAVVDLDRAGSFELEPAVRWATAPLQALEPAPAATAGASATPAAKLWVASATGALPEARAERVLLPKDGGSARRIRVPAHGIAALDLDLPAGSAALLFAESRTAQPGMSWRSSAPSGRAPKESGERIDVVPLGVHSPVAATAIVTGDGSDDTGGAAAAAIVRAGAGQALVWNASGSEAAEIDVRQVRFDAAAIAAPRPLAMGIAEGWVPPAAAIRLELDPGGKRVRLTLGARLAAALVEGDSVRSSHWNGGAAFEETLDSAATQLWLLNTGTVAAAYRIALRAAPAAEPLQVTHGRPFEIRFDRPATARLAALLPADTGAPPPAGSVVHVRGAGAAMTMLQSDGRVLRGQDLPIAHAATLLVAHDTGPALLWIDSAGARGPRWESTVALDLPSNTTVALTGDTVRLRPGGAPAFHLEATSPAASIVVRGAAEPDVSIHPAGTRLDVLAGSSPVEITLRGLGGAPLEGTATLVPASIGDLTEGEGSLVLVPAGGRRYFTFTLPERRRIGIGVRSSASRVEAELYSADGQLRARGIVHIAELEAGRYYVALAADPASSPTSPAEAIPILVGLHTPGNGPPEDVIRAYLRDAGAQPDATDASATEPDAVPSDNALEINQ